MRTRLPQSTLTELKRWNTPAVYNGWEAITRHDRTRGWFNREETRDFMPEAGPMVGYAVTVVCEPSNPQHQQVSDAPSRYLKYVASIPGPKIVVVQDLDKPEVVGSFWGEVNAGFHAALGCVGTVTDGAVRDIDEMRAIGFKAIARRSCVGHAYSTPVRWGDPVEVFGCSVQPGALIHADKHGFLVVPQEDQEQLLQATRFMDGNECRTVIAAAQNSPGKTVDEILPDIQAAAEQFRSAAAAYFSKPTGEW
ncbi:MAG: RraA family protein [Spirochaetaceae bacterium]|nr:MAG: RraA family protein [Spirochaetaceae bacterium]